MNSSRPIQKLTAKKNLNPPPRICQGDIFENVSVIESLKVTKSSILKDEIKFPYVVCLNQECDLLNDYNNLERNKDSSLLHIAIAPAFIFENFLSGSHWGDIFVNGQTGKRSDTKIKNIMDNEIPRYHYLKFPEQEFPELIIDFKHFFTINRDLMYSHIDQRMCSISDLFREKISQRFSYFLSRIGLPEE